jgi:chlorobactene glucosyltransferase
MLTAIAWILILGSAAGLAYWLLMAYRVRRTMRTRPTIRAGLDLPAPQREAGNDRSQVSIIVPVHNEQDVIDAAATALRNQRYEPLQIIFVLDRCTDGTLEALRRHADTDERVILIEDDSCPADWAGKCHAARLGAERATGAYLLFTDADTVFEPDLVQAAVTLAAHRGIHLLSLLSTLTCTRAFERIAQPVASLSLMRMYPIERVNRPSTDRGRGRPFANGQFMLFDRAWYEKVGGHAAVKDALLEDIALARAVHGQGGQCGIFLADGMLTCSMYDSLDDFRLGWKRIFIEACKRKPWRLRKHALRMMVRGLLLPIVQAAALVVGVSLAFSHRPALGLALIPLALGGWLTQLLTLMHIYGLCRAPRGAALLYPIGCWLVARIMLAGASDLAHRRPIPWAGRSYVLEPR